MNERIEKLQAFLERDPEDSFSRYALGLEYRSIGEQQRAVGCFEETRSRAPEYLATYYQLGKALQDLGLSEKAREAFEEGLAVAERQGDWHTHAELEEAIEEL